MQTAFIIVKKSNNLKIQLELAQYFRYNQSKIVYKIRQVIYYFILAIT